MSDYTNNNTTYTIPLEVGFNDIRECRIDGQTTAADILSALLGDAKERPVGQWALLETVYERGVLNNSAGGQVGEVKMPQMVIKELRLLEPGQPMHELLKDLCPDLSSSQRSTVSVINASNETVVFFNPYFRMLTGLPLSHISMFPTADATVARFNQQIRVKLGLSADDDRFALFGYYGKHVARLEEKCRVADLKATWEGEAQRKQDRRTGFFQFQAVPEKADQELLGIERASWLYVKREAGFWQSNRKLYCVLKGTTLFMYKSNKSHEKVGQINDIDTCRVFNLGANVMRTRHQFQIVEAVKQDKQPRPNTYLMSSPYAGRVKKWLRVLARCRRTFESQIPVTYDDPDGEVWWSSGRLTNDNKVPFNKRRYRDRHTIDPNGVPAGEMTADQRSKLDSIDAVFQAAVAAGEMTKQNNDLLADWLEKVRLFAVYATSLARPGFSEKATPIVKQLINAANRRAVDAAVEVMAELSSLYKRYTLDLASFPSSPTGDVSEEDGLIGIRSILADRQYYQQWFEEVVPMAPVEGTQEIIMSLLPEQVDQEQPLEQAEQMDVAADEEQTTIGAASTIGNSEKGSKKEGSILKKMKRLLISSRPSVSNSGKNQQQQQQQVIIEIDPQSPARTDVSGCVTDQGSAAWSRTVNEPVIGDLPPRATPIDARSTASSRSSFGRRAKALWNRVTSPLSAQREEKLSPTVGGRAFTTTSQGFPLPAPPMMGMMGMPPTMPAMATMPFVPTPEMMAQFYEFQQFRQFQMMQMQQQQHMQKGLADNMAQAAMMAPIVAPNGPVN